MPGLGSETLSSHKLLRAKLPDKTRQQACPGYKTRWPLGIVNASCSDT